MVPPLVIGTGQDTKAPSSEACSWRFPGQTSSEAYSWLFPSASFGRADCVVRDYSDSVD